VNAKNLALPAARVSPDALDILRRAMVARIATLSRSGRPSVNPLYFVLHDGKIWLGTVEWTLAARNASADPRVSLLFNLEQNAADHRVLRVSGPACVRTDAPTQRLYSFQVAWKYLLAPGGIRNTLANLRLVGLQRDYRLQNAQKGGACVIEVTPERIELL
jgi:general stress protein 26